MNISRNNAAMKTEYFSLNRNVWTRFLGVIWGHGKNNPSGCLESTSRTWMQHGAEVTGGNAALYSITMATCPTLWSYLATAAAYNGGRTFQPPKNRPTALRPAARLIPTYIYIYHFLFPCNPFTLTDPLRGNQVTAAAETTKSLKGLHQNSSDGNNHLTCQRRPILLLLLLLLIFNKLQNCNTANILFPYLYLFLFLLLILILFLFLCISFS